MGYDDWLEKPYRDRDPQPWEEAANELMDEKVLVDGRLATVISWEAWEDADEDGKYGGIEYTVRFDDDGDTQLMASWEVKDALTTTT
jgi:hypothetical protein